MIPRLTGLALGLLIALGALYADPAHAQESSESVEPPETSGSIETLESRPGPPPGEDWRDEIRVLRIGVLAPSGADRELAMMEPFRAHMMETLGLPVELVPARDMRTLIDAIVNARVDYARLSASAFASGWALCRCLEPLAVPLAADGTNGYYAIAVTKTGSGIGRLVDLKDRSVVFSDMDSLSGYLLPVSEFRDQGIDPDTYFARQNHAGGPVAAVAAMLRGEYDVAFAWSSLEGDEAAGYSRGTLHRMVAEGQLSMGDIRIAWQSKAIPHPPQVVRTNLPDALKSLLRAALFDLAAADPAAYDAAEPSFPGGFAAVTQDNYNVLLHAFAPR